LKLIIAGGRDFNNFELVKDTVYTLYDPEVNGMYHTWLEIVSGGAKGADYLGEQLAKYHEIHVRTFHAEWDKYSVAAGPYRNKQMGDYADELLAFWDGKSKGTKHMIDYMNSLGKPVWVRMYTGKQSLQSKPMKASPKK
jgi:hypothetical protein